MPSAVSARAASTSPTAVTTKSAAAGSGIPVAALDALSRAEIDAAASSASPGSSAATAIFVASTWSSWRMTSGRNAMSTTPATSSSVPMAKLRVRTRTVYSRRAMV